MKKILLIILVFIVGCTTEPEPEDCAGVPGGFSYVDDCGICYSDNPNDCVQDCAAVWGGSAVEDCAGTCGGSAINDAYDNCCVITTGYCDCNSDYLLLWGECYSIENTIELDLSNNQLTGYIPSQLGNLTNLIYLYLNDNQLTGEIPPEIGNLTNLTGFYLQDNQLSGIIPDEICNQGDSSPSLSNNQLCPPYPSCIEDYVGNQDTSDCP